MALGIRGTGFVWNLDKRQLMFQTPPQSNSHGPPLALNADGRRLAGLQDGTPVVWALDDEGRKTSMTELDCGQREGLAEHCIARPCDRLTTRTDPQRWAALLGDARRDLIATLRVDGDLQLALKPPVACDSWWRQPVLVNGRPEAAQVGVCVQHPANA